MRRLTLCAIATALFVTAAPSDACMPPHIYFDLGSARLDADARSEIDYAVDEYPVGQGARIRLYAWTDRVGPADANMRLARRRGEAVKAALVRHGIPANVIDIIAGGKSRRSDNVLDGYPNEGDRAVVVDVVTAAELNSEAQAATC